MKTLSDLEQEKQKLLQELQDLKKQIQQDISIIEKKYTSQNITKNVARQFSKQYLNKKNLLILCTSAGVLLLLYALSRKRKNRKQNIPIESKNRKQDYPKLDTQNKKPSFIGELAKEMIWTISMEIIRKKVNEYLKKKNMT